MWTSDWIFSSFLSGSPHAFTNSQFPIWNFHEFLEQTGQKKKKQNLFWIAQKFGIKDWQFVEPCGEQLMWKLTVLWQNFPTTTRLLYQFQYFNLPHRKLSAHPEIWLFRNQSNFIVTYLVIIPIILKYLIPYLITYDHTTYTVYFHKFFAILQTKKLLFSFFLFN